MSIKAIAPNDYAYAGVVNVISLREIHIREFLPSVPTLYIKK